MLLAALVTISPALNVIAAPGELAPPFRAEANGKPIDMSFGSAAPFAIDFDGDGLFDLMVGQRGDCTLKIFKNTGTRTEPRFGVSAIFKAGGVDASLPGG
jgi:hypothetical protein